MRSSTSAATSSKRPPTSSAAYKPNIAFFEALGREGLEALPATLDAIPPDIPVIIDAKRGDIGNTAAAYARVHLRRPGLRRHDRERLRRQGRHRALPRVRRQGRHRLVPLLQPQRHRLPGPRGRPPRRAAAALAGRRPQVEGVERKHGNVGIVMGATYPEQLTEARAALPRHAHPRPRHRRPGRQPASDAVIAGLDSRNAGIIVNASRSILYASRDRDYPMAARAAAARCASTSTVTAKNPASRRPEA